MAVNSAFHTSNSHSLATERSLYQNLIKEAIQIYGHDVYYVNRDTIALDNVLGEDTLSKFNGVAMLGGVTMNGGEIYQQAQEQLERLEEQIQLSFETPIDYMVG